MLQYHCGGFNGTVAAAISIYCSLPLLYILQSLSFRLSPELKGLIHHVFHILKFRCHCPHILCSLHCCKPTFTEKQRFVLYGVIVRSGWLISLAAIDSNILANLNFFEQFAAAAYCEGNNNVPAGGPKLTCSSGNCPLVETNDVTTVYEFQK